MTTNREIDTDEKNPDDAAAPSADHDASESPTRGDPIGNTPSSAPKRRHRFNISLRVMMILVLIFGTWLGWFVRSVRIQQNAVAAIKKAGGTVVYDLEWRNGGPNPYRKSMVPEWLGGDRAWMPDIPNSNNSSKHTTKDQTCGDLAVSFINVKFWRVACARLAHLGVTRGIARPFAKRTATKLTPRDFIFLCVIMTLFSSFAPRKSVRNHPRESVQIRRQIYFSCSRRANCSRRSVHRKPTMHDTK